MNGIASIQGVQREEEYAQNRRATSLYSLLYILFYPLCFLEYFPVVSAASSAPSSSSSRVVPAKFTFQTISCKSFLACVSCKPRTLVDCRSLVSHVDYKHQGPYVCYKDKPVRQRKIRELDVVDIKVCFYVVVGVTEALRHSCPITYCAFPFTFPRHRVTCSIDSIAILSPFNFTCTQIDTTVQTELQPHVHQLRQS